MSNFIVYTFTVPGESLPFYVGKGRPTRPQDHFWKKHNRKTHFYDKLNSLLSKGIYPEIKVIASDLTEQQAFDLEISLIKIYGRQDIRTGCLCNHTDGGDGSSGGISRLFKPHSIDTRLKISQSRRGKQSDTNIASIRQSCGTAIESFNLKTGVLIKRYEVTADVSKDGFNRRSVSNVLRERTQSSGGLGWRYST